MAKCLSWELSRLSLLPLVGSKGCFYFFFQKKKRFKTTSFHFLSKKNSEHCFACQIWEINTTSFVNLTAESCAFSISSSVNSNVFHSYFPFICLIVRQMKIEQLSIDNRMQILFGKPLWLSKSPETFDYIAINDNNKLFNLNLFVSPAVKFLKNTFLIFLYIFIQQVFKNSFPEENATTNIRSIFCNFCSYFYTFWNLKRQFNYQSY